MSNRIKNYFVYLMPFVALAALFALLNLTSPLKMGPAGILLAFAFIYIFLASSLYVITFAIFLLVQRFAGSNRAIKKKKLYYMTSIVALGPVFLLALNSIGQLDLKDFILVVLLIGVACFYVSRRF